MGPKSGNVGFSLVLIVFFEGSRGPRVRQGREQPSEPDRLGGGRGRVNPPPCGLVLRFGRFGGFVAWLVPLHAWGPEASADWHQNRQNYAFLYQSREHGDFDWTQMGP